ncbi:MAG: ATP-binding protein [Ktedonobacteraceae bacterium]
MSTAIWGESDFQASEAFSPSLLRHLLHQMIVQFTAGGGIIALFNENIGQMEICLHLRVRKNTTPPTASQHGPQNESWHVPNRPTTAPLSLDSSTAALERLKRPTQAVPSDDLEDVSPQQCSLFPVGNTYAPGQDLVGYVWGKNEPYVMRHEDYLSFFYSGPQPLQTDVVPTWYLATPIQESMLVDEIKGRQKVAQMLGVVILYQTMPGPPFQQRQRPEALNFAERIALYLQNDRLRQRQLRIREYLHELQEISAAFPSTVQLATLVDKVYEFVSNVVDVSSMLITLYDRDTRLIYDVFAVRNGKRVEDLAERPLIIQPADRPTWWRITQEEKRRLLLEDAQLEQADYNELLTGTWGDQHKAGSFLLLPMKMFNRVIGSLCLTSQYAHAYQAEEIQVLETMVQIITVSIENAKLYDRSRQSLREARQREEALAGLNSALQSISTVLNTAELVQTFVESASRLVEAEMSIFFQLSADQQYIIAQAAYEPRKTLLDEEELAVAASTGALANDHHTELLSSIRIPFKGSVLEQMASASFFYLDEPMAEELAKISEEEGAIFLRETGIQKMLMVPVLYQTELIGILGVHTPQQSHIFRPADIGMLLAICGQAASAIRNAQLFAEIQEAYAEQQRLDKLKDEFLVTASHELRTPLSAISGYATLLKRQSNRLNPQQILRFASKITGATQQLTDLVSSMTEAAKIGTVDKKLDLQIGLVQVQSATEMAINMLSVNIEQKIVSQVEPNLWVQGDPLRVRQVISNLLDNAAKYSPPDGRIEILTAGTTLGKIDVPEDQSDIEADPDMPVVLVQVYDEGEGILPEDQKRIFEKFVRAPRSLTTPVRGSGLGLYICRRYIEAMGGRLWLQHSIPGEGSAFSFYLPRIEGIAEIGKDIPDESKQQTP